MLVAHFLLAIQSEAQANDLVPPTFNLSLLTSQTITEIVSTVIIKHIKLTDWINHTNVTLKFPSWHSDQRELLVVAVPWLQSLPKISHKILSHQSKDWVRVFILWKFFFFCFLFSENLISNHRRISPQVCLKHTQQIIELLNYQLYIRMSGAHQDPRSKSICLSNFVSMLEHLVSLGFKIT